jgi:hypothetical protein
MHSTETVNQFLNLRVKGWSFARIAAQLHVSKPTVLDWNRKHQSKLECIKADHERSAHQTLSISDQHELQTLTTFYSALRRELVCRTLKGFSDDEIQALALDVLQQINKLNGKGPAFAPFATPQSDEAGSALCSAFDEGGPTQSNPVKPSPTKSTAPLPLPVNDR